MSTRRTSPKDSQPAKSNEKPFLDLAAINEKGLADAAEKSVADLKRQGRLPPRAKYDPKENEEYDRMLTRLFGDQISKKK